MRTTHKLLVSLAAAAGLAAIGGIAYAFPPGYGPGGGACPYYGAGPGPMGWGGGPGAMMGWGGGPGRMGWGGGPGYMGRGGFGPGAAAGPVANADARLAFLKDELKITAKQEGAWDAYAKQVKGNAEAVQALFSQAPAQATTAPDRIAQRAAFAKQRAAHMEAMSTAVKGLYAALTPEQKTVADQYLGGWAGGRHGGTRGYGRHGYGPVR